MKISKQSRRDAKELFRSAQVNGLLDEGRVGRLVDEILLQKPRGYQAILAHLQRLIKLDLQRRSARVESFGALSAEQQTALKASLEKRYGAGLNYSFTENSTLLGGVRVQVGSDVFDGSVRSRLNELEQSFEMP
jgi:F-type H+-transporting ATPase subunit delta